MLSVCLLHTYKDVVANGCIDRQTKSRCQRAAQLWKERKIEKIFITGVVPPFGKEAGTRTKEYLIECGVPREHIVLEPRGLNTGGEISIFLEIIGTYFPSENIEVVSVSTWYHVPRIRFLWDMCGWRLKARTLASWGGTNLTDVLIEPLKILNALLRPYSSAKVLPTEKMASGVLVAQK